MAGRCGRLPGKPDMKMHQIMCCAGSLLLAVMASAGAAALPPKVTLYYDVMMGGMNLAETVETLEHDGKTYRIASDARGKGIVAVLYKGAMKRSVSGKVTREGLRPLDYQDQRGDRDPTRAVFDWERQNVARTHDGRTESAALPANASDRLSFFYQFAFVPLPARDIDVNAVDGKGSTHFHFLAGVKEKLATPLGELDTIRLSKKPEGPDDKQTEVWLAPAYHNLPVRILITEKNGNSADQIISRIEQ
jgi:hypothetical protein